MPTRGIDFEKLSLRDALDLAILIEEEAQGRYEELADQMELHHTPEAAEFFHVMARNEARHGARLAERRHHVFGTLPCLVQRSMLFDVEAPEYDEARAFMTRRAALSVALHSESKAQAFFAAALQHVHDPEVRRLFEELCQEEIVHQQLVRAELDKLPADPDLDPDDFTDEPVGM
jgi:rubrerythrin